MAFVQQRRIGSSPSFICTHTKGGLCDACNSKMKGERKMNLMKVVVNILQLSAEDDLLSLQLGKHVKSCERDNCVFLKFHLRSLCLDMLSLMMGDEEVGKIPIKNNRLQVMTACCKNPANECKICTVQMENLKFITEKLTELSRGKEVY